VAWHGEEGENIVLIMRRWRLEVGVTSAHGRCRVGGGLSEGPLGVCVPFLWEGGGTGPSAIQSRKKCSRFARSSTNPGSDLRDK
jgi:hypothetical protein